MDSTLPPSAPLHGHEFHLEYGERITPLEEAVRLNLGSLPKDTIFLEAKDRRLGQVVVNCPITFVPMTKTMARTVHLQPEELQDMVDRRAPLGISPREWVLATEVLFAAFDDSGLLDDDLVVKVGGFSTHGFSSRATFEKEEKASVGPEKNV